MSTGLARVIDIAEVIRGVTFNKTESSDRQSGGRIPILRAGNIQEQLVTGTSLLWVPRSRVAPSQVMRRGDIALCASSGSPAIVGKSALLKQEWDGSVGAFCLIIRPNADVCDPAYLSLFFRSKSFRNWTQRSQGINIKNIRKSELESFPVPLPPLHEQRRIVDILSRANGIRRLRREALGKTRQLIPALFVDMFGDPSRNPKGWPKARVVDVLTVKGGKRLPKGSRYSDHATSYRYLRGTDINPGWIAGKQMLYLPEEVQRTIRRYTVDRGDVVITIAGKIGIVAPIGDDLAGVNLTENAAKLTLRDPNTLHPVYLSWHMNSGFVQEQIRGLTGRVTIGKLALERIERIQLLVPGLPQQREFAERVADIQATIAQQERMAEASEQLVAALMARLFDGAPSKPAALAALA